MATGYLQLFPGGTGPDASASSATAAMSYDASTTVGSGNVPKVGSIKLLFDATADEHWFFSLFLPGDYASGGTLRGKFKMTSATTGNVVWKGSQGSTIDSSTDDDALTLVTPTGSGQVSVPATQGQVKEFTITLTTTNMAANRRCVLMIGRDADSTLATDDATGDAELLNLLFEYTTA
jgi:hypothetical protein